MILEAVLLGLSTGTYCAMYCGPVLIPFLFGTEKKLIYFIFFLKFAIDNISSQLYILSHPLKTKEQNKKY